MVQTEVQYYPKVDSEVWSKNLFNTVQIENENNTDHIEKVTNQTSSNIFELS
jgi:hypothetical protein